MNATIWTISGIAILITLLLATGWWRYVLTGYLIAKVDPYEQSGSGAGRILVIGDSTGYGTGADTTTESVAGRLGTDYPDYSITNNSVNGRKIASAQEVVDELADDVVYDLVLLQIAANDLLGGASASTAADDLQRLVDKVKPHANKIVIISAGNIGASPKFTGAEAAALEQSSREFDQLLRAAYVDDAAVTFVSLFDEPENDPFVQSDGYTAIDGLHPTSKGYALWYSKAKSVIAAALQ